MLPTVVVMPFHIFVNAVVTDSQMPVTMLETISQIFDHTLLTTFQMPVRMVPRMFRMPFQRSAKYCLMFSQKPSQSPANSAENAANKSASTSKAVPNTALMTFQTASNAVKIDSPHVSQNFLSAPKTTIATVLMMFHTKIRRSLMPVQMFARAVMICSPCFSQNRWSPPKTDVATVLRTFHTVVSTVLMTPHVVMRKSLTFWNAF